MSVSLSFSPPPFLYLSPLSNSIDLHQHLNISLSLYLSLPLGIFWSSLTPSPFKHRLLLLCFVRTTRSYSFLSLLLPRLLPSLSVCLSLFLSVRPPVYLPACMNVSFSVGMSVSFNVCMSVCMSVCLCLSASLSLSFSLGHPLEPPFGIHLFTAPYHILLFKFILFFYNSPSLLSCCYHSRLKE